MSRCGSRPVYLWATRALPTTPQAHQPQKRSIDALRRAVNLTRQQHDIGAKTVILPSHSRQAARAQAQLNDFIGRAVADALTTARAAAATLTPDRVLAFAGSIYEQAFGILQIMGDAEAEGA